MMQRDHEMDPVLVLQERWWMIAIIMAAMIAYLATMDFRKFLAVVAMNIVFQLVWELTTTGTRYPFASLHYDYNPGLEIYMFTVPWSAILLKSIVYASSSYVITSAASLKVVEGHVDLVTDRGHKVIEHVTVGAMASITHAITMIAVEPLLANGSSWFLGPYEHFTFPLYFGVDPWYFAGVLASSLSSFMAIAVLDSRIGFPGAEPVLFNYEREKQGIKRSHATGFVIHATMLVIPSFFALFINSILALVNFLIVIPAVYVFLLFVSWNATRTDKKLVTNFCKKQPGSFLCRM